MCNPLHPLPPSRPPPLNPPPPLPPPPRLRSSSALPRPRCASLSLWRTRSWTFPAAPASVATWLPSPPSGSSPKGASAAAENPEGSQLGRGWGLRQRPGGSGAAWDLWLAWPGSPFSTSRAPGATSPRAACSARPAAAAAAAAVAAATTAAAALLKAAVACYKAAELAERPCFSEMQRLAPSCEEPCVCVPCKLIKHFWCR